MFKPKPLSAGFGDYAPFISQEIMQLHYTKHYFGYLEKLNAALEKYPKFFELEIHQIMERINEVPDDIRPVVRNNGGGAINHEIFWEILSTSETKIHEGPLKAEVEETFGSWDAFIEKFKELGGGLFGSGWVWLVAEQKTRALKLTTTPNQDSPHMFGLYPVFGIDLWEHSYYLQYKNVRKDYIEGVMKIINWKEVEKRFLAVCGKS